MQRIHHIISQVTPHITLCLQEPAYLHAEHMYDIKSMKHRKLKFGLACSGIVASGVVLPWMCVHWQLKKAGG